MQDHKVDKPPTGPQEEEFKPQGVLVFLAIMFIGYVLYWAYVYTITVIQRAGG